MRGICSGRHRNVAKQLEPAATDRVGVGVGMPGRPQPFESLLSYRPQARVFTVAEPQKQKKKVGMVLRADVAGLVWKQARSGLNKSGFC
jgi:hypothetical protein